MRHAVLAALAAGLCACADGRARPPVPPPAPAPAAAPMPDEMPALLSEIEAAYKRGDYDRGLALVKHALELKSTDVSTYDRIGSVYYVLGRYGEALTFWSRALPLERDAERRDALRRSIAVTRRSLGLPDEAAPSAPTPPTSATPSAPAAARPDPKELERLYKRGVRFYAEGEYLQATEAFLRVLDLDPGNAEARKALERLRLEPGGAGAR